MSKWDSVYGCTYCNHMGVRRNRSHRYPELNQEGVPPFDDRTHESMIRGMLQSRREVNIRSYEGHKGLSQLMLIPHLDLREGQAVDDLHQDHEGSAADLTELLLTTQVARLVQDMSSEALFRIIDARLLKIKTPSRVSRKPKSIKKRGNWNGSEWRNWLLFYGVPCLLGLIKPEYLDIFARLSYACYLLAQESIERREVDSADRLLIEVGRSVERIFGVGRLKYNLHVTTKHKVRSVKNLGNPYNYSTYNFESLNMKMGQKITSPKGALMQIATRSMLKMSVYASQYDERLPEEVRIRIEDILNPYQLQVTRHIGHCMQLVGHGIGREVTIEERTILQREGIHARNIVDYKSFLISNTRYKSLAAESEDSKSSDCFVYTFQETFCTIRSICSYVDGRGQERYGAFVIEHDVAEIVAVANHISVLSRNEAADLHHFVQLNQIRYPALKILVENIVYAVCVPNCREID